MEDIDLSNKNERTVLPEEAELVCIHRIVIQSIFYVDEYLYLRRTPINDEFWLIYRLEPESDTIIEDEEIRNNHEAELLISEPFRDGKRKASMRLFDDRLRAHIGYHYHSKLLSAGLLRTIDYDTIVKTIDNDIIRIREEEESQLNSLIISEARELGLNPEPPLLNKMIWSASCPGTSHRIFINARKNEFGCGYCGVKGDHETLKKFVRRRVSS
jgi:hypothetical protein